MATTLSSGMSLNKLHHYEIRGVANDWIRSYLTNRKQFVSINGTNSDYKIMKHGVPQGSVLGPLLFLIYINDLHVCIKYSKLNLFADDSSLLLKNASHKQLQKYINLDLKNLCNWLKANKISLNAGKTELVIFRHPNKKINYSGLRPSDGLQGAKSRKLNFRQGQRPRQRREGGPTESMRSL